MSSEQSAKPVSKIEIEQELRQLNDEWVKALVRRDSATLDRIMADDFVFAYPLEGDDKAQFLDDVLSGDLLVEHLSRENLSVRIWEHTAVLTGRDSVKWIYKGRELAGHYKMLSVYIRRDNLWQLVTVQACPIP
jgi:uncharacterized protein DUF4440